MKFKHVIDNIWGGISSSHNFFKEGEYLDSLAIDPDWTIRSSSGPTKIGGILTPTNDTDFTSTVINSTPMWIVTSPRDTLVYTYLVNGRFVSYSSSLGSETNIATPTAGNASGMAYYNNFIYLATTVDISSYGPIDNTPALVDTDWTGTGLGSQTALTDTTYLSLQGTELPNHAMHYHAPNNRLYFCDFKNGEGLIHFIKTKRTTDDGDTNDGSKYNALNLPFGYKPTDIESWGGDLVIAAMFHGTDTSINQGPAKLFFWDTVSNDIYKTITLPDPIVTSLLNNNGNLFIWTGTPSGGYRILQYIPNTRSVKHIRTFDEGTSPLAGAVDAFGERIIWGSNTSDIATSAVVKAYGSKDSSYPKGIHNISRVKTDGGSSRLVTCLKYVQLVSNARPIHISGWRTSTDQGINKDNTTSDFTGALDSVWRSKVFKIGRRFKITKVILNFPEAIAANQTNITPKIFVDSDSTSNQLTVISSTNYTESERTITLYPKLTGNTDYYLELAWAGNTTAVSVDFPIIIEGETIDV